MRWSTGRVIPGNRWDLLNAVEPDEAPTVSVIVAHYRQPEQLARTLHALARQDHPAERMEVIVADDGSPELPNVPDGVRLVRQDDAGFRLAAVRNLGVAAATGDVLIFLDADTAPEPAFVRELARLPALAPDLVAVGRRRHAHLAGLPTDIDIERAAPSRELPAPAWLERAYRDSRDLLDADDRSYRFVIGAVLACSRRLYGEVGGFDESFTSYGGEDWEWAYRAWISGAMLAHVRAAVAWHDGPDAAGRSADTGPREAAAHKTAKNDEAIRLSDLIPVPGSRGHGRRSAKVDVAVSGPCASWTRGEAFVSIDSVLAAVPGAEVDDPDRPDRFDRVRLRIEILRPVRSSGEALTAHIARVASERLGSLTLANGDGEELLRIVSTRADARHRRWGRDDLFPTERTIVDGITPIAPDVDVEAYLGGW